MASTGPSLARTTRDSGGVMPVPRTSRQHTPPPNMGRGSFSPHKDVVERQVNSTKSEISALTFVNTRNNGSVLPSSPNEKFREIVLPTFDEAIIALETGDNDAAFFAMRTITKLLDFLTKRDLWDVIDALSIAALDEAGKKVSEKDPTEGPRMRAACLELMVIVHKRIMGRNVNGEKVSGKVLGGKAEVDGVAQEGLPLLDARSVSEAVEEQVNEHSMGLDTDFLDAEERMAIAIVSLMESRDYWIGGAAERASCEIDSPVLRQALSGKLVVDDVMGEAVEAIGESENVAELSAAFAPLEERGLKARELWRLMDALTSLVKSREKGEGVRAGALEFMIAVYDTISKFGAVGRDGGEIEKRMTIAIITASGTDSEKKVSEAAMRAVEEIDSPVLTAAFLSGQISGNRISSEKIDTALKDRTLDVELAKIISVLDNAS